MGIPFFSDVARQFFTGQVRVNNQTYPVGKTSVQGFKTVTLKGRDGKTYQFVEQNPSKASNWAELARTGHQVIQIFQHSARGSEYHAVSVDGKVQVYDRSNTSR